MDSNANYEWGGAPILTRVHAQESSIRGTLACLNLVGPAWQKAETG